MPFNALSLSALTLWCPDALMLEFLALCCSDALLLCAVPPGAQTLACSGALISEARTYRSARCWRSAALTLACSDALLLGRFFAPTLFCSGAFAAPTLGNSNTLPLRNLPLQRFVALRESYRTLSRLPADAFAWPGRHAILC